MKKLASIISIIFFVVCFTGCKGPVGLGDRAIVKTIFLDYNKNQYEVGLVVFTCEPDSDTGSAKEKPTVYEGKGESIYKAISDAENKQNKKPFYAQNELLLVGEYLAQNKAAQTIDYFVSQGDKGRDMAVYLYRDGLTPLVEKTQFMGDIVREMQRIKSGDINGIKAKRIYECTPDKNGAFLTYLPILKILNEKDCISDSIAFFDTDGQIKEQSGEFMQTILMLDGRTNIIENKDKLYNIENIKINYSTQKINSDCFLDVNISGDIKEKPGMINEKNIGKDIEQFATKIVKNGFANKTDYFGLTNRLKQADASLCEQLIREKKFYTKDRVRINFKLN